MLAHPFLRHIAFRGRVIGRGIFPLPCINFLKFYFTYYTHIFMCQDQYFIRII